MILITAFEPFDNRLTNNSMHTLENIKLSVDKKVLPVDALKIKDALYNLALNEYRLIIMLGEHNKKCVFIETKAINQLAMRIKDNGGNQFNRLIVENGPKFLKSPLTIHHKDAIISKDAGLFLCNQAYYLLLNHPSKALKLFIHVPRKGDYSSIVEDIIREIKETNQSISW
ncbi:MAG: hypothetical protein WC939_00555 [Acholeplasmataceae bacterium]